MLPEDNNDDNGDDGDVEYAVIDPFGDEVERYDYETDAEIATIGKTGYYVKEVPVEDDEPTGEDPDGTVDVATDETERNQALLSDAGPSVYSFMNGESEESAAADRTNRWGLGSHSTAPKSTEDDLDRMLGQLDDDVDAGLRGALEEAAKMVSGSSIGGFECAVCGLHHGHSDTKHDIRDPHSGFSITDNFADQMEFSPFCHCGVNELAMLIEFYPNINAQVFENDERFATVKSLDSSDLQGIMRECREIRNTTGEAPSRSLVKRAVAQSGVRVLVEDTETFYDDLKEFYSEYRDIKNAADGAPVPGHVRTTIEENREWMEDNL